MLDNLYETKQYEEYKKTYDTNFCVNIGNEEMHTWFNLSDFLVYKHGESKVNEILEAVNKNLLKPIDITFKIRFQSRNNKEKVYSLSNTFNTIQILYIKDGEMQKNIIKECFNKMIISLLGELTS